MKSLALVLAFAAAAAVLLGGCTDDLGVIDPITDGGPVVQPQNAGGLAVAHGSAVAVQPWMIHEEVEGADALPVDGMRSDNPDILEVRPTSHPYDVDLSESPNGDSWVLVGVAPGSTILRLYRGDDEVYAQPVDVVEVP